MSIPTKCIIRKVIRKPKDKLNVLTFIHNGIFETLLAKTGHNFYSILPTANYRWNLESWPQPKNFHLDIKDLENLPPYLDLDLLICNNRVRDLGKGTEYGFVSQLSRFFHIPFIVVDHHCAPMNMKIEDIDILNRTRPCKFHISVNEKVKFTWMTDTEVINYGVNLQEPKDKTINLLVVGEYNSTAQQMINNITRHFEKVKFVKSLTDEHLYSKILLNLSTTTNISYSMLQAMAGNCAVISNPTPLNEDIIQSGINGYICSNTDQFIEKIRLLLKEDDERNKLCQSAQQYIDEEYKMDDFLTKWNDVFTRAAKGVFIL